MALPDPDFIDRDPTVITQDMITGWEQMTGKTLYPAQVERLLIDLTAYRETLTRIGIQEAAKLNLVNFSRAPMLDFLGELVGTTRLVAQASITTVTFTLDAALVDDVLIPEGTRISGGNSEFATDEDATIEAGATSIDVAVTASVAGVAPNGILPGGIAALIDVPASGLSVSNLSTTSGGLDAENDDRLKERIKLAPERFAVAGPKLAYLWHAKSVSQSVVDVGITSPDAGRVNVYPLTTTGLPDSALLDDVREAITQDKVRPLTDWVTVAAPTRIAYDVTARVTAFTGSSESLVVAAVQAELDGFADHLRASLGSDLVPSQWIDRVHNITGVYQVEIDEPAYLELLPNEWPDAETITVTFDGFEDG